jgi:pyruvate ferredoxin oxidoreductase gamma subunit
VGKEHEHTDKKWFVPNKDLIVRPAELDPVGADPYITGEAYLDEKRVDGGLL